MQKNLFKPEDLRPIHKLCADGVLQLHPKTAERLARTGVLPAIKIGGVWRSTPDAIRSHYWRHGNAEFRKSTV
jgi:hypothetical protein